MAKELIHGLDLLEVGCHGFVELISRKTTPDHILPLKTVPVGLPPILPGTLDHLEGFLSDLESLAIHDFRNAQKYLPREPRPDRLYYTDVCPVQTTIVVERNPSTGELQSYKEEYLPERCKTSKNSLSLSRAPGPSYADVRGSAGNFPFWPGGLDEPILENLEGDNSIQTVNFDTDFLTVAPGMKDGIIFQKATPVIESVNPSVPNKNVINLVDILMQSDDIDIGDSDEEDSSKTSEQQVSGSKEPEASQLGRSESLENLVQIQEKESLTVPDKIEDIKVEQWAFKVDINSPVDDFYKRIPDMAHKWDFELDIFQKQAILHLEKRESVFVAAHTSAGKTVVAEYAIALSMKNMTRTVYTSPIKALSNQKFRDFKNTFNSVGLITGDVQINTTASCLIMTTEILRSMLYNGSDVIRDLEWVIFDEVHYINDSERGVVWEEVLIMLPDHVNIILLSATVPNTMEFADWIGRTKRKKIYVISTLKRPVPLEHYLYTGNSNKTSNELFLILDAKGSFLTTGYTKAVAAKKERASKSSENFGAKGPRGGNPSQDKNIWLSVIEMLKKKEKLPMVAFIFSKRRIEENMINLQSVDLTTAAEKSEIHRFFHKCISRLKKEDRKLPQVVTMENTLKRGLGVHHSGILPILKEVVEMLFQQGLVKILFATETFAMGVNMPARTVVFDSIRKHDGIAMRNLLPGEYVQMAGRAGRRGLDSTGTVIILCKGDVPETAELHKMMLGRPTQLESQFRLTYTMILNLLGVDQLKVEDMMRRSFSEFRTQRDVKQHEHTLEQLKAQLKNVKDIECYLCSIDLEKYYHTCREYQELKKHLQKIVLSHPAAIKALSPGRVVIVDNGIHSNVLGVVLQTGLGSGNSRIFSVLIICNRDSNSEGHKTTKVNDQKLTPVLNKQLFIPDTICWHSLLELEPSSISVITSKTIKIDADKILKDVKKREQPRFKDDPPSQSVTMATQELLRLSEENPHGLSGLDPVKDLKLHDIDLVEQFRSLQFIKEEFPQFQCINCPKLDEHFQQMNANMQLKDEYRHMQFLLSDQSLQLLPEYQQRREHLHYIDASSAIQLKGRVACQISTQEIMITELIFDNVLTELDSTDIAALLSSMVFEQKKCSEPNLTDTLQKGCDKILAKAEYIGHLQREMGLKIPVDDYKMEFHFGLMEVVFEWARGMPFADIILLTDVQEGIIVRCIQRLYDLLHDVRNTARTIGDPTLFKKMDEAMTKIKRDIVFAASLYTQ